MPFERPQTSDAVGLVEDRGPGKEDGTIRACALFVTNSGSNTVSVLDARSGTVRRTILVGHTPTGIMPLTDQPLTSTTADAHNVYMDGV